MACMRSGVRSPSSPPTLVVLCSCYMSRSTHTIIHNKGFDEDKARHVPPYREAGIGVILLGWHAGIPLLSRALNVYVGVAGVPR